MAEDRSQDLNSSTCGIFQLYFYNNLFSPNKDSKILDNTKLTKKTVETLLKNFLLLTTRTVTNKKWNNMLLK